MPGPMPYGMYPYQMGGYGMPMTMSGALQWDPTIWNLQPANAPPPPSDTSLPQVHSSSGGGQSGQGGGIMGGLGQMAGAINPQWLTSMGFGGGDGIGGLTANGGDWAPGMVDLTGAGAAGADAAAGAGAADAGAAALGAGAADAGAAGAGTAGLGSLMDFLPLLALA